MSSITDSAVMRPSHSAASRAEKPTSRSVIPARQCSPTQKGLENGTTPGVLVRVSTLVSARCVSATHHPCPEVRRRRGHRALRARFLLATAAPAECLVDRRLDRGGPELCLRCLEHEPSMSTRRCSWHLNTKQTSVYTPVLDGRGGDPDRREGGTPPGERFRNQRE